VFHSKTNKQYFNTAYILIIEKTDRHMLWLLKMVVIGVYMKVGKTQYFKLKFIT